MTFDLMRVTSCESVGSEMCSMCDTKCEGETAVSVAGTLTLLCLATRSQTKTEPGHKNVCLCVCVCARAFVCMCVFPYVTEQRKSLSC